MPWNIQRTYLPTIWISCSSSASNAAARHLDRASAGLSFSTARRCKARGTVRRISLLASDKKSGPSNPPLFGNFGDCRDFHQGRAAEAQWINRGFLASGGEGGIAASYEFLLSCGRFLCHITSSSERAINWGP